MEMSENSAAGVNPLYKHKVAAATSTEATLGAESLKSTAQAGGTGSNQSLPTDGPLRQTTNDATNLSDNDDAPAETDPADDERPDDDVEDPGVISSGNLPGDDEEGDEEDLFDDDFEVDGDSADLNTDIDDDDLDTLDGPLLDENNPRH
jgi:hypothetical protein